MNLPLISGCISNVALKIAYENSGSGLIVKSCQQYILQNGTFVIGPSTSCTGNILTSNSTVNFTGLSHYCNGTINMSQAGNIGLGCTGNLYDRYLGSYTIGNHGRSVALTGQFCQKAIANLPPVVTNPGSLTNVEGDNINYQILASDPNGNVLTYQAAGLPSGLSINANTGLISGVVASGDAVSSPYNVSVQVTDSFGASTVISFSWRINILVVTYSPPVITQPANQTSSEGNTVSLQIQATDPNGLALSYSATGLPSGLTINSGTGLISGTISPGDSITSPYTVTVTASDGKAPVASVSFSWTVSAPVVTYNPPVITQPANQTSSEGNTVSLQIQATDPNGLALSYSATGLPSGLTINSGTGLISGTISPGDSITSPYSVTVTVSDGKAPAASVSFSWIVAATTKTVTLSWNAVTQNADGTPITNLAGYIMYYTDVSGDWSRNSPIIVNAPTTTGQIANLISGKTYYFAVSAFNTSSLESSKSVVVTYTVP